MWDNSIKPFMGNAAAYLLFSPSKQKAEVWTHDFFVTSYQSEWQWRNVFICGIDATIYAWPHFILIFIHLHFKFFPSNFLIISTSLFQITSPQVRNKLTENFDGLELIERWKENKEINSIKKFCQEFSILMTFFLYIIQ